MAGKRRMKQYHRELKLEAMQIFYGEGMTQKEIIEILGINDIRRVKKWLHPPSPNILGLISSS